MPNTDLLATKVALIDCAIDRLNKGPTTEDRLQSLVAIALLLGVPPDLLACRCDVSKSTIEAWAVGESSVPTQRRIHMQNCILACLREVRSATENARIAQQ